MISPVTRGPVEAVKTSGLSSREVLKTSWSSWERQSVGDQFKGWVGERRRWGQWRRWMMMTNRREKGAATQWRKLFVWRFGREVEKFYFDYVHWREMKNCQVVKWREIAKWREFAFKVSIVDVVEEDEFDAYVGRRFLVLCIPEVLHHFLKASQASSTAAQKYLSLVVKEAFNRKTVSHTVSQIAILGPSRWMRAYCSKLMCFFFLLCRHYISPWEKIFL